MSRESNVGRAAATAGSACGHRCRGCPGWTGWGTRRDWLLVVHAAWGLQPLGFINLPELLAFPCITCLREAGSGQDGYSTGAA